MNTYLDQAVSVESVTAQDLTVLSDEDLVAEAQAGNSDALECIFERYRDFIHWKARSYFLSGAHFEDLVQEAMIGFYESIRDYRRGRLPFRSFARICVTRQIIEAVKLFSSKKHMPLNCAISLDAPVGHDGDDERTLLDILGDIRVQRPEQFIVFAQDTCACSGGIPDVGDLSIWVEHALKTVLTDLEREVLQLHLEGYSYQDIASKIGRNKKAVDNALQRIKRKLAAYLND